MIYCPKTSPTGDPDWHCTRSEGHDGPCALVPGPRPNEQELTKHCKTCTDSALKARIEAGETLMEYHEGCTIEHGHKDCIHDHSPKPADDLFRELSAQKFVVLFEIAPNTDRYQQVMLTKEGLQRVNFVLINQMLRPPKELHLAPGAFVVVTNPAHAVKLENVPAYYPKDRIEQMLANGPDFTRP